MSSDFNRAIFLDRDGTLIFDHGYIKDPDKVDVLPGVIESLELLLKHGFMLFVVTNQSGVGRGMMSMDDVHLVNKKMLEIIGADKIKEILICPHAPDENCECRKPNTKLVDSVIEKYHISRIDSYSIGDKDSDKELAERFGGTGIKLGENGINSLLDATKFIIKHAGLKE